MARGLRPVHPGEVLLEVLQERGMTQVALASKMGVSFKHVNEICNGRTDYSAALAIRLGEALREPTARFWMHLMADYQLESAKLRASED